MNSINKGYYFSFNENIKNRNFVVPIYKFIPFEFALTIIRRKTLLIGQTMKWEDVYENFLTKAEHYIGPTRVSYAQFLPAFYGQSWTLTKETDALWRIYSNTQQSVRLKTTIRRLLETSSEELNYTQWSTRKRVIGQVKYMTNSQINKWTCEQKAKDYFISDKHLLESLFIKRKEFLHEKEVRLIIHKNLPEEGNHHIVERPFLELSIDPNDLIDEIAFDPRINKMQEENLEFILRAAGYKNKIYKSKLYDYNPR